MIEIKQVLHDPVGQKFYIPLVDDEAVLAYTQINELLDIHTLLVPDGMESLEESLIKAAFDYVEKNNMKIIATEKKMLEYVKRHTELEKLIEKI